MAIAAFADAALRLVWKMSEAKGFRCEAAASEEESEMLETLNRQTRLTASQWKIIAAAMLGNLMDFFDYFIIGFVLAFIIGPWGLTFGQSALVLLSSGVGAIVGGPVWGYLADRKGRRPAFLGTIVVFSLATGALALTPDNGWIYLVIFRFIVGFGTGGLLSVDLALVSEFVPGPKRGFVVGLVTSTIGVGVLLGAIAASVLTPLIGWRGLFAVGLFPAVASILLRSWVPESPRWLLSQGRPDDARRSMAAVLEMPVESITLTAPAPEEMPRVREIFGYPRSLAISWITSLCAQTGAYGVALWAPTLLVLVLHVKPERAATLWIFIGLTGISARFIFSWFADRWGRRVVGALWGLGAVTSLSLAAMYHDASIGGLSIFYLMLFVWAFFGEGGQAVLGAYLTELWPSRLRATGMGSAYGFGGIGKIIGPGGLALIIGASNVIKPEVTLQSLTPSLLYFAAFYLVGAIAWVGLGIETGGRSLESIEQRMAARGARRTPEGAFDGAVGEARRENA
jgi:MFS transporter, putative metabolite:H+ symporter